MIYAYYGGKSGLFDATLAEALRRMAESMWAQLERPEATAEPLEVYRNKAHAVATTAARPAVGRRRSGYVEGIERAAKRIATAAA